MGAIDVWQNTGDFRNAVNGLSFVSNIHLFQNNLPKAIEKYRMAIVNAKKSNNMADLIRIYKQMLQVESRLGVYEQLITDIQTILQDLGDNAFIDLFTMAEFHIMMADAYLQLKQEKRALDEYMIALSIYNRFSNPVSEQVQTLTKIIEIYQHQNLSDKIEYYTERKQQIEKHFKDTKKEVPKVKRLLGDVKEFWVFTVTGLEIYSYSPESSFSPELLGGFLSAVQMFSMEISKKEINSMVIGEDRYSFYKEPQAIFFILARSSIKSPEKVVLSIQRGLFKTFYAQFKVFLDDFANNVTPFQKFNETIQKIDVDALIEENT
jgi:tetratricopeptide (TPR) repeat protein